MNEAKNSHGNLVPATPRMVGMRTFDEDAAAARARRGPYWRPAEQRDRKAFRHGPLDYDPLPHGRSRILHEDDPVAWRMVSSWRFWFHVHHPAVLAHLREPIALPAPQRRPSDAGVR